VEVGNDSVEVDKAVVGRRLCALGERARGGVCMESVWEGEKLLGWVYKVGAGHNSEAKVYCWDIELGRGCPPPPLGCADGVGGGDAIKLRRRKRLLS
jgi:hypothetical protein